MKISGIYKIVHVASGRCYVGQSVDVKGRWKNHRSDLRKGVHCAGYLQNVYNKYGIDSLSFEVIEQHSDLETLDAREQFWMDRLEPVFNNCKIAGTTRGMRHRPESIAKMIASKAGFKHSPESIAKMRAAKADQPPVSAETREKLSAIRLGNRYRLGKPQSPEAKAKIAASARGRLHSPETKAKISAALKGRKIAPEAKRKMSTAKAGKPLSSEHRAKLSCAQRGRTISEVHRENLKLAWAKRKEAMS